MTSWMIGGALLVLGSAVWSWWQLTRARRELRRFLRVPDASAVRFFGTHAAFTVDALRALRDFLPSEGIQVTWRGYLGVASPFDSRGGPSLHELIEKCRFGGLGAPDRTREEVEYEQYENFVDDAVGLCTGGPFPFLLLRSPLKETTNSWLEGAVADSPEARAWVEAFAERFHAWCLANSCYRGKTLRPYFTDKDCWIPRHLIFAPTDDAPVQIDGALGEVLEDSLLSFWRNRDALREVGCGTGRGLLLCGLPGTGKSTTCKYLRRELPDHTFLLVDSSGLASVKGIFETARKLAPCVIIVEDVDLVLQSRDNQPSNPVLKDLLNELDGLIPRPDTSLILTSNSWHFMEVALADRPGRIDQVIFFEQPDRERRRDLLTTFTEGMVVEGSVEPVAAMTGGVSAAGLKEIVKRAMIVALRRSPGVRPRLTQADFHGAVLSMKEASFSAVSRRHGLGREAGFTLRPDVRRAAESAPQECLTLSDRAPAPDLPRSSIAAPVVPSPSPA